MRLDKKGLTLVELTIVIALLGVVLALGYTLYFFATDSFAMGETQSYVQYDVRMASTFITNEVRNSTSLTLIPTPTSFDNDFHYIFVKALLMLNVDFFIKKEVFTVYMEVS